MRTRGRVSGIPRWIRENSAGLWRFRKSEIFRTGRAGSKSAPPCGFPKTQRSAEANPTRLKPGKVPSTEDGGPGRTRTTIRHALCKFWSRAIDALSGACNELLSRNLKKKLLTYRRGDHYSKANFHNVHDALRTVSHFKHSYRNRFIGGSL